MNASFIGKMQKKICVYRKNVLTLQRNGQIQGKYIVYKADGL